VDEALPTTAALVEHYGVSQATIARVLRALTAEGLVYSVHGTRETCASLLAALDVHPRVAMRILR
jgi:DNA-binding FadR family transcriptional regulator